LEKTANLFARLASNRLRHSFALRVTIQSQRNLVRIRRASFSQVKINLGSLKVAELSPDMNWLSLSGRSRGGVWNLGNGEAALYLRGFSGGYLTGDGNFFGDFPKYEAAERNVAKFSLQTGEVSPGTTITARSAIQAGPFVIISKSAKANAKEDEIPREWKNITYEILDATNFPYSGREPFQKKSLTFAYRRNTTLEFSFCRSIVMEPSLKSERILISVNN